MLCISGMLINYLLDWIHFLNYYNDSTSWVVILPKDMYSMFVKTAEHLKPIQNLTTLYGLFPSADTKFYLTYSLLLLSFAANSYTQLLIYHFHRSKDIIYFTFAVSDITTFAFQASAVLIPILCRQLYLTCEDLRM